MPIEQVNNAPFKENLIKPSFRAEHGGDPESSRC